VQERIRVADPGTRCSRCSRRCGPW